jgi:hypothetical protein
MQFRPDGTLTFSYEPERHLSTSLTLKNTGSSNCYYKVPVPNQVQGIDHS